MCYMAGKRGALGEYQAVIDIYNPNDPSNQFYCDSFVDDPACYAPGGYYGPGGPGYAQPKPAIPDPTYNLPVQLFETQHSSTALVGGAILLYAVLSAAGKQRRTKRGGI